MDWGSYIMFGKTQDEKLKRINEHFQEIRKNCLNWQKKLFLQETEIEMSMK